MKNIKKNLNINSIILTGLGVSVVLLGLQERTISKRLAKLSKSFRRFSSIVTETEEERQKYEFTQDLRLEILEDMIKDIYKDVEIYGEFEDIDGTEV